jgi:hypothetical protein
VVFAVALALRVFHVWQMQASPFASILIGDAVAYDEWARKLAAGDWLGTPVFYQAPCIRTHSARFTCSSADICCWCVCYRQ